MMDRHRMLVSLASISVAMASTTFADARSSRQLRVYTCQFARSGTVIIDTREPKASITINGKRYPAQSGAYFYQSVDGNIAVMFGPGVVPKFWEYSGERDSKCRRS